MPALGSGRPLSLAMAGRTLASLTVVTAALAGCSRPVAVNPPVDLDPAAAQACAQLEAALPGRLDPAGARREVTPESLLTAAWGDPPVSLRCGVPIPVALRPDSVLVTVNGIDWLPEELTDGYLLTTVGRVANVELTVPQEQGPAPGVAADLAEQIKQTVPVAK